MKNKDIQLGTTVRLDPSSKWATGDVCNPTNVDGVVVKDKTGLDKDPLCRWVHVQWGHPANVQNAYLKEDSDLIVIS